MDIPPNLRGSAVFRNKYVGCGPAKVDKKNAEDKIRVLANKFANSRGSDTALRPSGDIQGLQ